MIVYVIKSPELVDFFLKKFVNFGVKYFQTRKMKRLISISLKALTGFCRNLTTLDGRELALPLPPGLPITYENELKVRA